jgi:glutathione S-transferase
MSLILFTAPTPDGYKVSIALEEMALGYTVQPLDLTKGEQKRAEFLKLNPNGKVPCLIDDDFAVMESGAILVWLAEKSGQLLPAEPRARSEAMQWLMLQVGGLGPMMGQANLFGHYWPEKLPAVQARYLGEVKRLFAILDSRLADRDYLAGDYSIALGRRHFSPPRRAARAEGARGFAGDGKRRQHRLHRADQEAARARSQRSLKRQAGPCHGRSASRISGHTSTMKMKLPAIPHGSVCPARHAGQANMASHSDL